MRLSGYNAAPSLPCWKALDHYMRYLCHIPHVPRMFPRTKVKEQKIVAHHAKGEAEITDIKSALLSWLDTISRRIVVNFQVFS